jgi:type IV pilus assembly protein PilQ
MMGPFHVAALSAAFCVSLATPAATPAPGRVDANGVTIDPAAALARVTGVAVQPAGGKAELRIGTDAEVQVSEFRLDGPDRLVVDLTGARLGATPRAYDGVARGGIRNIRISQYRADVVRVVVDLDGRRGYELARDEGAIRIAFDGATGDFAAWESGAAIPAVAARRAEPAPRAEAPAARAEAAPAREARNAALDFGDTAEREELPLERRVAVQQPRTRAERPRITVTYQDADIRDVIAAFAAFSGRTIVVGREVTGAITAEIKDKPWDVALQAILQSQGLAATEDPSGILTVDSFRNLATNQALEPLVTKIVDINYQKATALVPTVQQLLARDCSNLTTGQAAMGAGGGMGMGMQPGMGMGGVMGVGGGQGGQQQVGAGCVIRGSVVADSATNKLLITDAPSRLDEILAKVADLDMRTPQVAIKAKIIFVNRTGIQDIGIAYDLGTGTKQFFSQLVPRIDPATQRPVDTNGDGVPDALGGGTPFLAPARISVGGNAVSAIANANNAIKPDALNLIYSMTLGKYQLTSFVNALQRSQLADVQSEPSTVTLNNRTAEIFVGQEIPIRVIDASAGGAPGAGGGGAGAGGAGGAGAQTPNAAAFFPRSTVQLKEAGIRLSVTPQITLNRMIMLNLRAENSSAEIGPSDVGFVFNQQRANTQVLVADGETAVIGGLTVTEVSRSRQGIPVLMNLPFIGRLFAQNTRSETKRDLLVLVTPSILDETASVPPGR